LKTISRQKIDTTQRVCFIGRHPLSLHDIKWLSKPLARKISPSLPSLPVAILGTTGVFSKTNRVGKAGFAYHPAPNFGILRQDFGFFTRKAGDSPKMDIVSASLVTGPNKPRVRRLEARPVQHRIVQGWPQHQTTAPKAEISSLAVLLTNSQ
jgi:hypothetical protein